MDKIPRQSNNSNVINDTESLKEKTENKTAQGQVVRSVLPEKQLPVSQEDKPTNIKVGERSVSFVKDQDVIKSNENTNSKVIPHVADQLLAKSESHFDEDLILSDMDMGFYSGQLIASNLLKSESNDEKKIQALKDDFSRWESSEIGSPERRKIQGKFEKDYGDSIPGQLSVALIKKLYEKGIPPESICEHVELKKNKLSREEILERKDLFNKELQYLLKDMASRNIGISSKMSHIFEQGIMEEKKRNAKAQRNGLKRIQDYTKNVLYLADFDAKFEAYLSSGECPLWDSTMPLYRGGDGSMERKMLRNLTKEKPFFRSDLINRGGIVFGYGQYYTNDILEANKYAGSAKKPVITTTYFMEGTAHVNASDTQLIRKYFNEKPTPKRKLLDKSLREFDWESYLKSYVKHSVIVEVVPNTVYTLPKGDVISHVTVQAQGDVGGEGPKSVAELSMHRLGEDGCILGKPETFKEEQVLDEKALESTEFLARGHITGEPLPTLKYQVNDKTLYVVKSTDKESTYWQVKQRPESLGEKPEFILEPSEDFLLKRKQEKLAALNSEENRKTLEKQAEENREIVRSCFEMACAVREP